MTFRQLPQPGRPRRARHRRRLGHRRRHGARPLPAMTPRSPSSTSRPSRRGAGRRARRRSNTAPLFLACDLTDIDALRGAIDAMRGELGPVAVLVNNAANDDRHAVDAGDARLSGTSAMNVNLRHQFFAAQAVQPHMRELGDGSIINFSSMAWMFGGSEMVAYSTAKAAVIGLTNVAGARIRPRQYPRQRDRARRRRDRAAAPPLVQRRSRPTRSPAPAHQAAPAARRHRAHGAVPGRRRQPHDHQAVSRRRWGHALTQLRTSGTTAMLDVGLNPYGLTYHLGLQGQRHAARQSGRPRTRRLHRARRGTRRQDARDLRALACADERRRASRPARSSRRARHDAGRQLRTASRRFRRLHARRQGARRQDSSGSR